MMESLRGFLSRYTNLQAPEQSVREAFIRAVRDVTDIALDETAVLVKQHTVVLHAPSAIKSEIRLNQGEVLERVGELLGDAQRVRSIY